MSACSSSGVSIMMTSAHLAASATSITLRPSFSAFLARGRALAQRDGHVLDAGIAQVQRVRVALAAVADDRDLLGLDEIDVGITIVINAHGFLCSVGLCDVRLCAALRMQRRLAGLAYYRAGGECLAAPLDARRPAADGGDAGARHLDKAELGHDLDELLELARLAGHLEHEMLGRGVDDLGAEDLGDAQRLDALLALARDLDQRQLALERVALDVRSRTRCTGTSRSS